MNDNYVFALNFSIIKTSAGNIALPFDIKCFDAFGRGVFEKEQVFQPFRNGSIRMEERSVFHYTNHEWEMYIKKGGEVVTLDILP